MEILETLFSSQPRVQILRTFLFQPSTKLTASEIAEQSDVTTSTVRSHVRDLVDIGLLNEVNGGTEQNGRSVEAWQLNRQSKLREPLHEIILTHQKVTPEDIADRLKKVGSVSLLVLSGIFTGVDDRPIDILIAGKRIDHGKLKRSLGRIEKVYGTELRYTVLSEEAFTYRYNVYDKLIRDVLDYPHRVLIDELGMTADH